jgi:hypothetical protein
MQVTDPAGTVEFRKEGPRSTVATVGIVVPLFGMENLQTSSVPQRPQRQPWFWTALDRDMESGFCRIAGILLPCATLDPFVGASAEMPCSVTS